jgi:hypothetical protein
VHWKRFQDWRDARAPVLDPSRPAD